MPVLGMELIPRKKAEGTNHTNHYPSSGKELRKKKKVKGGKETCSY